MKKISKYLPFHFVLFLILGIICQFYKQLWHFGFLNLGIIFLVFIVLFFLISNKIIRTFLSFILFFLIGISAVYIHNSENYSHYYKNFLSDASTVILKVDKVLKPGFYHDKYQVKIIQVDAQKSIGKALLNVRKNDTIAALKVDELIFTKANFQTINKPLNPHQFDYSLYLKKQGIQEQLYVDENNHKSLGLDVFTLVGISEKFRDEVEVSLQKYHFKPNELAVINALLLGQRKDISKDLISEYSKAGAIHILAVSGLHVGIILLILSQLLSPLERLKNGKFIKTGFLILLLWMFAFIAGLSPSVVRAVTMFTFLAFGLSFQRKNIIEFSLIASMFFLLIFKPTFLFEVGFQLSYLAVFGIIWMQPKLSKIWKPKFKIINFFWQLFTVSIAAQIGILPLSLYYFHQFPGLFLASNLVIIPVLGTILFGGVLVIFLAFIDFLPQFLADVYGFVISLMNNFISFIAHQEEFLFTDIPLSFLWMLAWYFVIFLGIRFVLQKSPKKLGSFFASILILQSIYFYEKHQEKTSEELIVFHKSRNTIIGEKIGAKLVLHHSIDSLDVAKTNALVSYKIGKNVEEIHQKELKNMLQFKNDVVLIIDSLGVYPLKNIEKSIILLQHSPKINLKRLIKETQPKQIIADGSNYKSYVARWQKICEQQKTPFHSTVQNGAYILK